MHKFRRRIRFLLCVSVARDFPHPYGNHPTPVWTVFLATSEQASARSEKGDYQGFPYHSQMKIQGEKLNQAFHVDIIPCLVFLEKRSRVITIEGVEIIEEYGVEGYPFTTERLMS